MKLHRDTTVSTLVGSPTSVDHLELIGIKQRKRTIDVSHANEDIAATLAVTTRKRRQMPVRQFRAVETKQMELSPQTLAGSISCKTIGQVRKPRKLVKQIKDLHSLNSNKSPLNCQNNVVKHPKFAAPGLRKISTKQPSS